ncbi:MAG: helix-turn-helix domain-containing protein [Treponema sp.]|nr:helix-turn-helix domain-containing protein [Treponema sp.]MCL2250819.1 helix-turn-helix domain-containing protein [Treponema sp.]
MTINERIKEIRRLLNKSQREFAKAIYVSNGYLSEIETGRKEVNERLIHLLSSTFHVNKQWLLTGKGSTFINSIKDRLDKMSVLFNELNPEFQDYVLQQMDILIKLQNKL